MKFGLGYDWKEVKRFKKLDQKDRSIVFYLENECDFIFFKSIFGISVALSDREFRDNFTPGAIIPP